jgi:glycosyltransferase involved in cell wall biosynthesis
VKTISYTKLYKHLDGVKKYKEKYLISIILPVYNEENTIFSILNSLPDKDYIEIIVIDDHSVDSSVLEIEKVKKIRNIKLYRHEKNKGYGEAILTGIRKANGKIIITMDSDGQHRPNDIYNLIKPILKNKADFTIGSRYLGSYHYNLPLSTRFGEILVEKLLLLFFSTKVENNQGGFRAFDRKIIRIFNNIQFKSYAFTTELIVKAKIYGFRIMECPISLLDRAHGKSRIILNKLAFNIFLLFLRYIIIKIKMKIFRDNKIKFKKYPIIFKEIN